jgi:hypothetical protein
MATQFVDLIEEAEDQRQRLFVDRELLADVERPGTACRRICAGR